MDELYEYKNISQVLWHTHLRVVKHYLREAWFTRGEFQFDI